MKFPRDHSNIDTNARTGVVLFSGGIDSAVMTELLRRYSYKLHALTLRYGQTHDLDEVAAATELARDFFKIPHRIYELPQLPPSAITGAKHPEPRTLEEIRKDEGDSPYVVPGRNGLFLSVAVAYAQAHGFRSVFLGATIDDAIGFKDCRLEYAKAWTELATLGAGRTLIVEFPLAQMRKLEVVEFGLKWELPLERCVTCYYSRNRKPCRRCEACMIRQEAFEALGA